MDWCILRCSSSQTLQLAASLNDAGFRAWTPVEVRQVLAGKERKPTEKPTAVIPSFVFARLSDAPALLALSRSPTLNYRVWDAEQRKLVTKGHPHFTVFHLHGRRSSVTEASLAPLRALEGELQALTERRREKARCKGPAPRFTAGQIVRIDGGGYEGLDLTVQHSNEGKLVTLTHPAWLWTVEISAWKLNAVQVSNTSAAIAA